VVARAELLAFLRSKSFLIGLLLPPAMGTFAALASVSTQPPRPPPVEYRLVVVDPSGLFTKAIEQAAAKRNTETRGWGIEGWVLIPMQIQAGDRSPGDVRRDLSERVKRREIWGFVEIPSDLTQQGDAVGRVQLHAATLVGYEFQSWFARTLQDVVRAYALRSATIPEGLRAQLEREIRIDSVLLAPRDVSNTPKSSADELGSLRRLPAGGALALMAFLLISLSAGPLMQGVIEEKTSRVSETLLASVSPFQLMLGKLLGGLAASGCGALLYGSVFIAALRVLGVEAPASLFVWFSIFLVLGALLWGSIFLVIGASCTDIKDTQNLVLVAILLQMLPVFFLSSIIRSPASYLALGLSLFPASAPLVMLLRLSAEPLPPVWQPALAAVLLAATAVAAVWVAGRIFRMGLLAHDKSATLREIWRWVRLD